MKLESIQSPEGLVYLNALVSVFPAQSAQMRLQDILEQAARALDMPLDDPTRSALIDVLMAYSSPTMACPAGDQVLCIFQDLGDGIYALLTDDETIAALQVQNGAAISAQVLPEQPISRQEAAKCLQSMQEDERAEEARQSARLENDENVYGQADYYAYSQDANHALTPAANQDMNTLESMSPEALSMLDEAHAAVLQARERAERAERENSRLKDHLHSAREQIAAADKSCCKAQAKRDKKIRKAQDRIDQQERKIADHQAQIEDNRTGMMKSLHKAQIRHDQKVIDRKERKLAGIYQDMACRQTADSEDEPVCEASVHSAPTL